MGARKLVDFSGPHGWPHSATDLGRVEALADDPCDGLRACRRRVLPLTELRADFVVSRTELADNARGALDADLDDLDRAAAQIARAENVLVFHGYAPADIVGVVEASPHPAISTTVDRHPQSVAGAVGLLQRSGISGPYGLAVGPAEYTGIIETTERGGYPLWDHLNTIGGGPIVWTPGLNGGVVLSLRGGDFRLESGQDLSVGFDRCDGESVHLYLQETLSFRVTTAEATVGLPAA